MLPSSGSQSVLSKQARSGELLGSLSLHSVSEVGGSTFLRNMGKLLPDYTTSHPGRE
jgi:hypothetical protein